MSTWLIDTALLVLACAVFGALVLLVSRSAMAGAGVALGAFVLFEATSPPIVSDLVFQQGSFSVHPMDVVSIALLSVGVWRLFSEEISGPVKVALLTIVLSLVAHLIWGAFEFGLQQATDYSRGWFTIVSGVVYAATVKDWDSRLPTAFIATGCLLAAVSIVQILRRGLHSANTFIDQGGQYVDARPTVAVAVLVMLQALIMLLARKKFTLRTACISGLLISGIVLLQYRTLWVTAIACALLGAFYLAMRFRASNERAVYALTGATLVLVPILLFGVSQVSAYRESAESATGETSTLAWRIEAWKALVGRHSSAFELLIGTPSGTERQIVVDGRASNLSAHDVYVEALLLYGLVGFLAFSTLALIALRCRHDTAQRLEITAPTVVVLLASQALVALTHIPNQTQGLLFGCLLSVACYQTRLSEVGSTRRRPGSMPDRVVLSWPPPAARTRDA
jgi:hypothetical protein